MPNRTTDEIRALDGAALTRLAWELHLEPHDLAGRRYFGWETRSWGDAAIDACGTIWRPHERVDQADAAFRTLRARGWRRLTQNWDRGRGTIQAVKLLSTPPEPARWHEITVEWPRPVETEAHALLLVSVLAVMASEQEAQS